MITVTVKICIDGLVYAEDTLSVPGLNSTSTSVEFNYPIIDEKDGFVVTGIHLMASGYTLGRGALTDSEGNELAGR